MYSSKVHTSSVTLPPEWDDVCKSELFLTRRYLRALDTAVPENITPYFLGLYQGDRLVGKAILQRVFLQGTDMFSFNSSCHTAAKLKRIFSKMIQGNVLVLGNLMHTGEHAYCFNSSLISEEEFIKVLEVQIQQFTKRLKKIGTPVHMYLVKDFFQERLQTKTYNWRKIYHYHQIQVQPNMVLDILPRFMEFSQYEEAISSKYKKRLRKARKCASDVERKELGVEELMRYEDTMHELYRHVVSNARFNTFTLPSHHFWQLKKELGKELSVFGYFCNGKMVGFFTLVANDEKYESYLLGYDEAHQKEKQLYLNMLYDMVEKGVESGVQQLVLARTALEIKSTLGATPQEMFLFIKHRKWILNLGIKLLIRFFNPSLEFTPRNPFKKEYEKQWTIESTTLVTAEQDMN